MFMANDEKRINDRGDLTDAVNLVEDLAAEVRKYVEGPLQQVLDAVAAVKAEAMVSEDHDGTILIPRHNWDALLAAYETVE